MDAPSGLRRLRPRRSPSTNRLEEGPEECGRILDQVPTPESARTDAELEQRLESHSLQWARCPRESAREGVEDASHTDADRGGETTEVSSEPQLLLRRTESDQHESRSEPFDDPLDAALLGSPSIPRESTAIDPHDSKIRNVLDEAASRGRGDSGAAAEQQNPSPAPRGHSRSDAGEIVARQLPRRPRSGQSTAPQQESSVHDREIGTLDRLGERGITGRKREEAHVDRGDVERASAIEGPLHRSHRTHRTDVVEPHAVQPQPVRRGPHGAVPHTVAAGPTGPADRPSSRTRGARSQSIRITAERMSSNSKSSSSRSNRREAVRIPA